MNKETDWLIQKTLRKVNENGRKRDYKKVV